MKNGVPFHLAFESDPSRLDQVERAAFSIVLSEFEGNEFNWDSMRFKDDK